MKIIIELNTGAPGVKTAREVHAKLRELIDGLPEDENYGGDNPFAEWPPCTWHVYNKDLREDATEKVGFITIAKDFTPRQGSMAQAIHAMLTANANIPYAEIDPGYRNASRLVLEAMLAEPGLVELPGLYHFPTTLQSPSFVWVLTEAPHRGWMLHFHFHNDPHHSNWHWGLFDDQGAAQWETHTSDVTTAIFALSRLAKVLNDQ